MNRTLMTTLQVLTCFGLILQSGCLYIEHDHRGHFVHRGAHHEHSERSGVEFDIKVRN